MSSTDTTTATTAATDAEAPVDAAVDSVKAAPAGVSTSDEAADLGAGLDALETETVEGTPLRRVLLSKALPPLIAVVLVLLLWQGAYAAHLKRPDLLPSPLDVWNSLYDQWLQGTILGTIWTSLSRGALGFLASVVIGTPIGLLVAKVKPVRAAIGPILSGLQSIPSVAWVPAAVIWFGLSNATIYAVVLLGAVPSIANGLVAGVDQVQPLYLRAGRTLGATGLRGVWFVLLPAALPGYLAGLKQGWAFAWRSLMAAELIASSPALGLGLGQSLENAREVQDMPGVLSTILLILLVGIGIELLIFAPLERRVLRSRGLLVARR
ncbi:NitT/TauT family transport system permease protein [Streptacidiphilus sp. MAP12-16]|uniref:ABC transporter permease n=1 Tax=Streptacidiphilus sp. MAP12-16 TaxID=3156300 RepID=UPI0035172278